MKVKHVLMLVGLGLIVLLNGCAVKHIQAPIEKIGEIAIKCVEAEIKDEINKHEGLFDVLIDEAKEIICKDEIYVVGTWENDRDCLWNIALKKYNNAFCYKFIYEANKDIIKDPNLIYPGQKLKIPVAK